MASTRSTLEAVADNLAESVGERSTDTHRRLSPICSPKDAGRRPLRNFGPIDVGQVMADPNQPRDAFSDETIERLAKSIHEQGQLSPIRVRWSDEHRKWMIVAGERRWRASLRAGLPMIECYFHEGELAPSEILEQQLIENCLREDLRPTEQAMAFQKLMDLNRWNQKKFGDGFEDFRNPRYPGALAAEAAAGALGPIETDPVCAPCRKATGVRTVA